MSPGLASQYTETQRREAAEWFVLINEQDDPETDTLQAWLQWMDAHEGNRYAFEAVAQVWQSQTFNNTPKRWMRPIEQTIFKLQHCKKKEYHNAPKQAT